MELESITSREDIRYLNDNEIFVFGSNLAGKHGRGAAMLALTFGAVYEKGEGLYGQTYGIPTKDHNLKTLALGDIELAINRFINHAKENLDMIFQVTEICCGLAEYRPNDISPYLKMPCHTIHNIKLPKLFIQVLS